MIICYECEQEIKDGVVTAKDAIALNKKLLGRKVNRFFCAACLADYFEIDKSELPQMVEDFKSQGCSLF